MFKECILAQMNQQHRWMLEPFEEVGRDVPEYFLSRTHFANIEDKKVIAKN